MTNTKNTKRALLSSVLALFLCFAMLLGTTYAWFTDSVTSANNVIKSGNLDIALDYWDGDSWETVEGTNSLFTNNLWEPGHTEVVYFKLSNLGSLALKYQLSISVLSETEGTNMAGDPFKLSDYIQMGVVEGVNGQDAPYATREAAVDAVKANSGIIGAGYAKQGNMLADAAELYMAVVVYMPETVGNEANAKTGTPAPTINLGVQVLATQMTAESDGFDNQYDEGATFGTYIELEAGADLLAAMASAEADMPLTIKLNGDVKWPTEGHHGENDITPASSIVIDGNGYTITATGSGVTPLGDQTAPMTLKNVKIVDNSVSYNEGAWELTYLEMGGKVLNCVDVDFVDPIMVESGKASFTNCTFVGYEDTTNNIKMNGVWMANGDATFSNCTFTGTRGMKICDMYAPEIGTVVIDGCTFVGLTQKPGVAIDNRGENDVSTTEGMTVIIKNSTFINCQPGDQGLYIYETDNTVPTVENNTVLNGNEVAEGLYYDTANKTFTIASKAGLMSLNDQLAVVAPSEANIQKVNLACDVDLAGETWTPINKMWVNFNGNGHTISNVTCAEGWRSGFFGYAGGVKVNDLTLENVTSAGAQAGTFAGSAEGLTTTNCFLKGTNTVTYVPYENETWGGVGAVTGVVASSNINVTLVEGATVTLNKSGLTTNCPYIDNLTGYLNANSGTVVNNGTVQVIDLAIATAEELFAFAKDVNENGNSYSGKTVALVADIDLAGKLWIPVGQTQVSSFQGTFDGQGHTIKNMTVNYTGTDSNYACGLFGWIELHNGAPIVIQNVKFDNANVTGIKYTGVVAGYANGACGAEIKNCVVTNSTVTSNSKNAGGIIGYMGKGVLTGNTVSGCTISAKYDVGGIANSVEPAVTFQNNKVENTKIYYEEDQSYDAAGIFTGGKVVYRDDNNKTTFVPDSTNTNSNVTVNKLVAVSTAEQLSSALNATYSSDTNIKLANDITLSGEWGAHSLNGSNNAKLVIDGNGKTIYGLTSSSCYNLGGFNSNGLVTNIGAGFSSVTFKNLTIEGANLTNNGGESAATGVFVGNTNTVNVTFDTCTVTGAHINSYKYAGGFIGYTQDVNTTKKTVTFKNCVVSDSNINTTDSSVGGLVGHNYTDLTITGCQIKGNTTIKCAEDRTGEDAKAGYLIGTVNGGSASISNITVDSTVNLDTMGGTTYDTTKYVGRNYGTVTGVTANP